MPGSITFYLDKSTQNVLSTSSDGTTSVTLAYNNVLNSPNDTDIIGKVSVTKTVTVDDKGNVWGDFKHKVNLSNGTLVFTVTYFNQTTSGVNNPGEIIPPGETSITLTTGLESQCASGIYCNQFGYINKVKNTTSNFRKYSVYFPQLIGSYTNSFNNDPQPSVAPLA